MTIKLNDLPFGKTPFSALAFLIDLQSIELNMHALIGALYPDFALRNQSSSKIVDVFL